MLKLRIIDIPRISMLFVAVFLSTSLALHFGAELFQAEAIKDGSIKRLVFSKENTTAVARKLLQSPDDGDGNRIGTACSKDDIVILQGSTAPLPNGIPSYTVQILNVCVSGCSISNIHVSCGWFSSARLVNPRVFRRVYYDDCLVNDGEPLGPGETLSFQYANSFRYPLTISNVACC
ncbi:TPD1 protein homolog 1 [Mangifera indica]|uniref:TPD1 protein homolog 1 n=1 Tax=Mangifera indica TaxID=29780 RepID=UPI001CFC31D0|nr:TPD1 protein homolog 1 [Mangifera indica]